MARTLRAGGCLQPDDRQVAADRSASRVARWRYRDVGRARAPGRWWGERASRRAARAAFDDRLCIQPGNESLASTAAHGIGPDCERGRLDRQDAAAVGWEPERERHHCRPAARPRVRPGAESLVAVAAGAA